MLNLHFSIILNIFIAVKNAGYMLLDFWNSVIVSNLTIILFTVYVFTVLSTTAMVIHEKRDPAKTSIWVLILLFLPIIGLIFYVFFGQNHRKEKIFSRKGLRDLQQIEQISKNQIIDIKAERYINNPTVTNNISIITLLLNNSKALLTLYKIGRASCRERV